ncbi:double-stranded RNA-binding protein 1-like isoform X3 [Quercus robur]|uniref:double-stranded RNA-binding protein 1-like isoform X3 n=1 Tax=Quercus robur TaxID=38942 RepID=UPI0021635121|nr:double-stranded RNA-binding protein 1-like isoform X3 [Quercus robur]
MAPSFAQASSTPKLTNEYEVFVSFRGADSRTGFTSHLFAALDRKTINAYKDDINLPRGEKIGPELLKAIETSRIAVVVFSKKYATSGWCLDELVKIMECKRVFNQRVLPIFYHVSQPEVVEQKGNFAELPNGAEDKRNSWRAALTEAASLAGLHLEPNRPESEFIEEIVEKILKILKEESSTSPSLRQNDAPGQHSSATIPHNDASSGLDLENYSWTQTLEEVTLNVTGTKSSSVVREIKKSHLKLGLKGQPPIIDWELFRPVKPDDCSWRIEDQSAISTLLTQHKMEWRKSIVKGDPEIDTQKVEPESSKLSDPDPETRQTVEKVMDNSGLYKNLLQELVRKEGFPLPVYDANRSGEGHEAIFVSTVEIREVFKGHEARTKKQAEMNAAKIAYTTMKEHMQHFYKNQLQNYARKRYLCLPEYSCECEGPPHASQFRCKVTVDGQTYESPEFFSTSKDAENAAAKVALASLVPDGAKEDNSGLYKNLLQELVQKEGFSQPVYDTKSFREGHEAIFVSTVEIREVFKGHEARTKKQAEMNAAKIAYATLKERKSGQGPLIVSPAHKGKETPEISSSSLQPNVPADLQQLVGATMNLNLCTIAERQAGEDRGPDTIIRCNRGSSVDASYGYAPDTLFSSPCKSENGLSSHSSTNLVMDSSLVSPAETIISSCKRIFVHPRLPNMTIPKGYTILPKSDDKWVAFSPN